MKISDISNTQKISSVSKKRSNNSGGDSFDSLISDDIGTVATEPTTHTSPVSSMDSLLSAQFVDYDTKDEKKKIEYGNQLLNELNNLKLQLLNGSTSPTSVKTILSAIKHHADSHIDPRLNDIIQEIELRAEVEIAKWEKTLEN